MDFENLTVANIGEKQLITKLEKFISAGDLEFNEDCSAFKISSSQYILINSDMLVGKTDVPPGMHFRDVGRKAVIMAISDICAKGGKPYYLSVSLGLPSNMPVIDVLAIVDGISHACQEYDVMYGGGDLGATSDLIIDATIVGFADFDCLLRRNGAQIGDLVFVSGIFGLTGAGLQCLLNEVELHPKLRKKALDAVYKPKAQYKLGMALAKSKLANSCIDSSDGLSWSLQEISHASKIAIVLTCLPCPEDIIKQMKLSNIDPNELILDTGEEFELVFSIPKKKRNRVVELMVSLNLSYYEIGYVEEGSGIWLIKDGSKHKLVPGGFEHFSAIE